MHTACHRCWQETGLQGNFAQDFVKSWEDKSRPVMESYAKAQDQWLSALKNMKSEGCPAVMGFALCVPRCQRPSQGIVCAFGQMHCNS
jgi:hypothetical protein